MAVGICQVLLDVHVTVVADVAPVSSRSVSGVVRDAPVAAFQFDFGTTPATSLVPIEVLVPTKSIPIARPVPAADTTRFAEVL